MSTFWQHSISGLLCLWQYFSTLPTTLQNTPSETKHWLVTCISSGGFEIKAFNTSIRTRITSFCFKVTKCLKADETKHKSWNTKYVKQNEVKWVIKPSVLYASLSKKGFLATDLNTNPTRGTERQYREMTITMIGRTRRQKWWLWNTSYLWCLHVVTRDEQCLFFLASFSVLSVHAEETVAL